MIREVELTSQGASAPMSAFTPIRARRACRMLKKCYVDQMEDREVLVAVAGGHWHNPDWAEYKYIDFGNADGTPVSTIRVRARGTGRITVRLDRCEEIASVEINSEDFMQFSAPCKSVRGVHPLWLFLEGDMVIEEFVFE